MRDECATLIFRPSSLITHHSSLIIHHSSLIIHPSSLITHPSSLIPHSLMTHSSSFVTLRFVDCGGRRRRSRRCSGVSAPFGPFECEEGAGGCSRTHARGAPA